MGESDWKGISKYQVADGQTEGCWYQYNWDIVDYEFIGDGKNVLDAADDAAVMNWGGDWRMPTIDDLYELLENTTNEWITEGTVSGCKITSKTNGNSIFLPAAGYRYGQGFTNYFNCYYWSSSVDSSHSQFACQLILSETSFQIWNEQRSHACSVRPVLKKK